MISKEDDEQNDKQNDEQNDEQSRLREHAKRLRELNDSLLRFKDQFVGKIPEELEELSERLEREFGPDLWKKIDGDSK